MVPDISSALLAVTTNNADLTTAVVAVAASVVSGLLGVAAGKGLDKWVEQRQWKRNKSAQACLDFFVAAEDALLELAKPEPSGSACGEVFARMTQTGATLDVFGDGKTARAAREVWNWFDNVFNNQEEWDNVSKMYGEPWKLKSEECRRLLDNLIGKVRRSLGNDEIPSSEGPPAHAGTPI